MTLALIKKTTLAALTIAVVATGSLSAFTSQAEAGGRYWGGNHGHHNYYGGHHRYKRSHGYGYRRHCRIVYRWKTNYYGESFRVKRRICN